MKNIQIVLNKKQALYLINELSSQTIFHEHDDIREKIINKIEKSYIQSGGIIDDD